MQTSSSQILSPAVTVCIPTWNAGSEFPSTLDRIQSQRVDHPFEILIVDSGSTDGTAEFLRQRGDIRLIEIPHHEFDHGLTRNLGIREARGEIVVFAAQDAAPANEEWLQSLVDCFDDARVAGAYSRQLPRANASPFIRDRLARWAAGTEARRVQSVSSPDEYDSLRPAEKLARAVFDNVSSSVRRVVALEIPFRASRFGEDLDWSYRALLAGYAIVYEPRSRVVHSHDWAPWYEFRRVYLDHQNRYRLFGAASISRIRDLPLCIGRETIRLMRIVASDPGLSRVARLKWWSRALPFAINQNLAQFLGARSVLRIERGSFVYRGIDRLLARGV